MSARSDVLLWAQRVLARKGQASHVLLEVGTDAGAEEVQAAFHKIARTSHPDLHRHGLTPEELELVTSAYATVAGAYQELRSKTMSTTRMQPLRRPDQMPAPTAPAPSAPPAAESLAAAPARSAPRQTASPPPATSTPVSGTPAVLPPGMKAEQAMSSKALLYFRKAELALRRGDLRGAILQLKLACATDPASQFLRTALVEVETEVRKST